MSRSRRTTVAACDGLEVEDVEHAAEEDRHAAGGRVAGAAAVDADGVDRVAAGREDPGAAGLLGALAEDDVGIVEQQRLAGDEVGGGDVFGGLAGVVGVLSAGEAFAGGAGGGVGGRAELDLGELHVGDVDREGDAGQEDDHHQRGQDDDRAAAGAEPFVGKFAVVCVMAFIAGVARVRTGGNVGGCRCGGASLGGKLSVCQVSGLFMVSMSTL